MARYEGDSTIKVIGLAILCLHLGFSMGSCSSPDTAADELSYVADSLRSIRINIENNYDVSPEMFAASLEDAFDGQLSWKEINQRIDGIDRYVDDIMELEHEICDRVDELNSND